MNCEQYMMSFSAVFFMGIPDNKQAEIQGLDGQGSLRYMLRGNAQFMPHLAIPSNHKQALLVMEGDNTRLQFKKPDILINCISDPDSNHKSLAKTVAIVAHIRQRYPDIPVFNDPLCVAATGRDTIYERYHMLPGLTIPRVVRIVPETAADVLRLAAENAIGYPFLIRLCGAHQSVSLQRINGPEDARLLETYAYDGSSYYLTEYVEYQSPDGRYRKARLVCIGGHFYPRHLLTSTIWEVHHNKTKPHPAANVREEEPYFIAHYRSLINPQTWASFEAIYAASGLDYLGFDFALRSDGTALIFEINPAQNTFLPLLLDDLSYLPQVREQIVSGFNRTVAAKVGVDSLMV